MPKTRRILMVAPVFHGYSSAIAAQLRHRGHCVRLAHYDDHGSIVGRARYKLANELPEHVFGVHTLDRHDRKTSHRVAQILRDVRPDVVLAIKADCLLPDFWDEADSQGAITHLWLYDEMRRMRHRPEVLAMVNHLSTYSLVDAQEINQSGLHAVHVPNGFDSSVAVGAPVDSDTILFVGARYPNREAVLAELHLQGLPVKAVGRDWSTHPIDRLRTWQWRRPSLPNERDVSRQVAYKMMAGASANLNMHFNQDGFTMRTFEIPGVGGLQFIDRPDVDEYYEPGEEVLVYSSIEELMELSRRAISDGKWRNSIAARAQKRTLAEHTLAHRVLLVEKQWD